jgi:predicted ArsR family transcriptional regulator
VPVSQHLIVLQANGLVEGHRAGRPVHYTATETGRALLRHQLGTAG